MATSIAAFPDCADVNISPISPIMPDRRESTVEFQGESGWRQYFNRLGVDAAVIRCNFHIPESGRHIYLVGLDAAKSDPQLSQGLIAYAESMWLAMSGAAFRAYSPSSPPRAGEEDRSRLAALPRACGIKLGTFISRYNHAAVMQVVTGADTTSALLFRCPSAGEFGDLTERRLVDALPLFHDAALAHSRSTWNEHRAALLAAMFDQVSLGTLLVDASGRPIFANEVAQRMLGERDFIMRSADGTLACASPSDSRALRTAIRTAATTGRESSDEISMRIGEAEGDWRLAVIVPASTVVGDQQLRCAMVLIHGPQHREAPHHMLKALGLLPSEQRFLEAFLKTSSLAEAARLSGLSEETARTYLKRVRGKLGVHRQLDLARLIYGLAPPIRSAQTLAAE